MFFKNTYSSGRAFRTSDINSERLSFLRKKHPNRVIIGHIKINFIRNEFDHLIAITKGNADVLMRSGTKLDEYFPSI